MQRVSLPYPTNKIFILAIALFIFSLFYVGCDNNLQTSTQPQLRSAEETIRLAKTTGLDTKNIDEEFAYIADLVPGFAGYYYDKDQLIVSVAKDGTSKEQIKAILKERTKLRKLSFYTESDIPDFKVKYVKYDFRQLKNFKEKVLSASLPEFVTFVDAQEADNTITIGIEAKDKENEFRQLLQRSDIPNDVLKFEVRQRAVAFASLRDKLRPSW
jgi:uncharacterized protein YpmB